MSRMNFILMCAFVFATQVAAPLTAAAASSSKSKVCLLDIEKISERYQPGTSRQALLTLVKNQASLEAHLENQAQRVIEKGDVQSLPVAKQESFVTALLEKNAGDTDALTKIISNLPATESARRAVVKFLSESPLVTRPNPWYTTDEVREMFAPGRFTEYFPWAQPIVERRVFNYMRRKNPSYDEVFAFIKTQKANIQDSSIAAFLQTNARLSAPKVYFSDKQIQTMFSKERFQQYFPGASEKKLGAQPQKDLELALKTDSLANANSSAGLNRDWVNRPDVNSKSLIGVLGFEPALLPVKLQEQISNGFNIDGTTDPTDELRGLIVQGAYAKDGHVLTPDLSLRRGMAQIERDAPRIMTLMKASLKDGALSEASPLDQRLFVESWEMKSSGDLIREIRQGALRAADLDPSFTQLRIEIHAFPNADVLRRSKEHLAEYKKRPKANPKAVAEMTQLIGEIETLLNVNERGGIGDLISKLPAPKTVKDELSNTAGDFKSKTPLERLDAIFKMRVEWRDDRLSSDALTARYRFLSSDRDMSSQAMREGAAAIASLPDDSRGQLAETVVLADAILKQVELDNFLLPFQMHAYSQAMGDINRDSSISDDRKLELISGLLNNAVDQAFYLLRRRYGDLDEKVFHLVSSQAQTPPVHFVDGMLRSHNIFMLSQLVDHLEEGQLARKNISHVIGDQETRIAAQVFNPGEVIGRLRINADPMELQSDEIGVFSQMPTESGPLGGIITLGVGARLSHLQLLAKALGIPNVKFSPEALKLLTPFDGKTVIFSADKDGQVRVQPVTGDTTVKTADALQIDVPVPDYRRTTPLRFGDGAPYDRYMIAGPKGMILMKLFRDGILGSSVPDGFILPFGYYRRYLIETGIAPMVDMLAKVEVANTYLISRLTARIRHAFEQHPIPPQMLNEILNEMKALQSRTGHEGGYFFRSDTNIEDLPGFNGAGLNESIPNVPIDADKVNQAVRDVWASAFKEKSVYWRARALGAKTVPVADPSEVVLPTVYARSCGVILSKGTARWIPGHGFISSNWGIGSVVEAGAPVEEITLEGNAPHRFSFTSANRKPVASSAGGLRFVPTDPGKPVLTDSQIADLNLKAQQIEKTLGAQPKGWDIEWAVNERGEVIILQARPLN